MKTATGNMAEERGHVARMRWSGEV